MVCVCVWGGGGVRQCWGVCASVLRVEWVSGVCVCGGVCASVLEGGVGAPVPPLDVLVGVGTAESGVGKWCVCVWGGVPQCWREVWVLLCLLWMCWWV